MPPYVNDQQSNTGSFVPTTNVWDISRLYEVDVGSQEFKELLVRLYQNVNNISLVLNTKDSGQYFNEEFVTGKSFFNPNSTDPLNTRGVYRKVIDTGILAAGAKSVAHGLNPVSSWKFIYIGGAASNTTTLTYYPLPFAGIAGNNISITVNATNIIITNNTGSTFTDSYVILEYVKN
jgi:hypothetical protein